MISPLTAADFIDLSISRIYFDVRDQYKQNTSNTFCLNAFNSDSVGVNISVFSRGFGHGLGVVHADIKKIMQ